MNSPVFVDELFVMEARESQANRVGSRNGHQWCHMWSEDVEALHAIAQKIGMRREWFQNKRGFPHYDLVPAKRRLALNNGAIARDLKDWIRERRERAASSDLALQDPTVETQREPDPF